MLRGNRFRLVTLGRLTLVGPDGEEDAALAKRRLKLAVLAVLAMARRPLTRDALLGLFWWERDEARARHSLSNALSSLRRALGPGAITTRDADVALAGEAPLDVDALELADAAEARDAARVVELYRGPFLESVHVDGSPAFEQWASRERRRLESVFLQACAQQCEVLARGRRWPECRALAARWVDTEPLSANGALFLLNAIKAPGTRAAFAEALDEYERLKARLTREFELAPEPVVRDLAARIREQLATIEPEATATPAVDPPVAAVVRGPAGPPDAPRAPDAQPASGDEPRPGETTPPALVPPASVPAASASVAAVSAVSGRAHAQGSRRALWQVAGVAAIGILALALALRSVGRATGARSNAGTARPVIALLAMDVRGADSASAWLSDGLPQLIAGKLTNNGSVDVVPPPQIRGLNERIRRSAPERASDEAARELARRAGATLVARGAIGRDGANVVLDLTVHDVRSGSLVHSAVLTRESVLALAEEAAVRLLAAARVNTPGPQLAELETSSLEAYRHYIRAMEAGHAGRLGEMMRELDAAIALDSGFITAIRARMSTADTGLLRRLRETVRRHAGRASEFDRLEQEVNDAFYAGEHERSEALARRLVRRYPRDPRGYHLLEAVLLSHGNFDEAADVTMQGLALDSLATQAGISSCTPCIGFASVVGRHWLRSNYREAEEWARRWVRVRPDAASGWMALAWTFSYAQRPDSAIPAMLRAVSLSGGDPWTNNQYARVLLVARRHDEVDSLLTMLERSPETLGLALDLRVQLERERGRLRMSNQLVDRLIAASPTSAGFAEMMRADNLRALGAHADAARRFHGTVDPQPEGGRRLTLPLPAGMARAFCWHHALAADALAPIADTLTLRASADTLEAGCVRSYYGRDRRLYHHVRGLLAMRGGRHAEAAREFQQAVWVPVEGWARTVVELARAQRALGRPRDAIATLRTGYATRLDAMGRYVTISELDYSMAQAFAEAGEADSARLYAGHVRRAWRDADPEIKGLLARLP